ncbi:MAG: HlyD family efflux transporter periplasmic adaptor subunit [Bacteroidales bacterium]|nr:HlyD family efflux transporter periplasmic adaptor subunit [Bacteroidales bacterium]
MKYGLFGIAISTLFVSCGKSDNEYDASGTFEATEIIVSSEAMGKILQFDVTEGQQLTENQVVGTIDSTQLYLKKLQLLASQKAMLTRRPDLGKQIAAIEQQIATAKTEKKRIQNLVNANAANQKQLDDVNAQIAVLEKQLSAQKSTIETTNEGISGDNEALLIQIEQIEDQLRKCKIISPINGTVLTKYAEKGELATTAKALFKIGDTNKMILRAYITADQITQLKAGQKVKVFADFGEDNKKEYEGVVSWISSKSEFTPKTIQTRDERANLVYAVKINVKNDGFLKIGMYGNVKL